MSTTNAKTIIIIKLKWEMRILNILLKLVKNKTPPVEVNENVTDQKVTNMAAVL